MSLGNILRLAYSKFTDPTISLQDCELFLKFLVKTTVNVTNVDLSCSIGFFLQIQYLARFYSPKPNFSSLICKFWISLS